MNEISFPEKKRAEENLYTQITVKGKMFLLKHGGSIQIAFDQYDI